MSKKMVSIFTLIVFVGFTFSCTSYTTKKLKVGRGGLMGKKTFLGTGQLCDFLKFDMVSEGIDWFESGGSPVAWKAFSVVS